MQRQLIDEIADTVAETTVRHDGFVSASFHASVEGRRVVNYAQWTSREAWERATAMNADDTSEGDLTKTLRCLVLHGAVGGLRT